MPQNRVKQRASRTRWAATLLVATLLTGLVVVFAVPASAIAVGVPPISSTLLPLKALPPATEATLVYCSPDGTALKMDLYRPVGWGAVPVVLQVHGGDWLLNNRAVNVTPALVSRFLKNGIAFATIDYRLGDARLAIEDVACAVRYLPASAKRLGMNPRRIGAMGQSAGGQLVSLLGTSDKSAGFDVGQYSDQSSRVQAVADEWGPVIFDANLLRRITNIPLVFGTSDLETLRKYSPLTYLTSDDPPFLVVQGAKDATVPLYQSTTFASAMKRAGVKARLIIVPHAGHYLTPVDGTPKPSRSQIDADLARFFVTHLRK